LTPVEDLLNALEIYYTTGEPMTYNPAQRRALISRYGFFSQDFISKLYVEIISIHEARFRTLPDAAVFSRVMRVMGDPRTYEEQQRALPAPEFDMNIYLDEHENAVEKASQAERERVRARKIRGNARPYELHWLWCQDELDSRYVPPECGPYFAMFGVAQQWKIPPITRNRDFRSPAEMMGHKEVKTVSPRPGQTPKE